MPLPQRRLGLIDNRCIKPRNPLTRGEANSLELKQLDFTFFWFKVNNNFCFLKTFDGCDNNRLLFKVILKKLLYLNFDNGVGINNYNPSQGKYGQVRRHKWCKISCAEDQHHEKQVSGRSSSFILERADMVYKVLKLVKSLDKPA